MKITITLSIFLSCIFCTTLTHAMLLKGNGKKSHVDRWVEEYLGDYFSDLNKAKDSIDEYLANKDKSSIKNLNTTRNLTHAFIELIDQKAEDYFEPASNFATLIASYKTEGHLTSATKLYVALVKAGYAEIYPMVIAILRSEYSKQRKDTSTYDRMYELMNALVDANYQNFYETILFIMPTIIQGDNNAQARWKQLEQKISG